MKLFILYMISEDNFFMHDNVLFKTIIYGIYDWKNLFHIFVRASDRHPEHRAQLTCI